MIVVCTHDALNAVERKAAQRVREGPTELVLLVNGPATVASDLRAG